jgi:cyclic pyranopterin phosphate synthase
MVDVSAKPISDRQATAEGSVTMSAAALDQVRRNEIAKGDVLAVARVAGIMAAKRTAELIPLCHPLPVEGIDLELAFDAALPGVRVTASVRVAGRTGVEMEALTAVSIACLTIYDMVKAVDRTMEISGVRLLAKSGGRSGDYRRPGATGGRES